MEWFRFYEGRPGKGRDNGRIEEIMINKSIWEHLISERVYREEWN